MDHDVVAVLVDARGVAAEDHRQPLLAQPDAAQRPQLVVVQRGGLDRDDRPSLGRDRIGPLTDHQPAQRIAGVDAGGEDGEHRPIMTHRAQRDPRSVWRVSADRDQGGGRARRRRSAACSSSPSRPESPPGWCRGGSRAGTRPSRCRCPSRSPASRSSPPARPSCCTRSRASSWRASARPRLWRRPGTWWSAGCTGYVRNPMYLAVAATIVGQSMILGRPGLLLYALAFGAAVGAFVRFYEEPTLARRFGAEYDAYRRAVPAWWPRRRPWRPPRRGSCRRSPRWRCRRRPSRRRGRGSRRRSTRRPRRPRPRRLRLHRRRTRAASGQRSRRTTDARKEDRHQQIPSRHSTCPRHDTRTCRGRRVGLTAAAGSGRLGAWATRREPRRSGRRPRPTTATSAATAASSRGR